jgi:hypothetical protein
MHLLLLWLPVPFVLLPLLLPSSQPPGPDLPRPPFPPAAAAALSRGLDTGLASLLLLLQDQCLPFPAAAAACERVQSVTPAAAAAASHPPGAAAPGCDAPLSHSSHQPLLAQPPQQGPTPANSAEATS